MELSGYSFDFRCPRCGFYNPATLRQVRIRAVVICRGCKSNVHLNDRMNECRMAFRKVQALVRQLDESLGRLNIEIRL